MQAAKPSHWNGRSTEDTIADAYRRRNVVHRLHLVCDRQQVRSGGLRLLQPDGTVGRVTSARAHTNADCGLLWFPQHQNTGIHTKNTRARTRHASLAFVPWLCELVGVGRQWHATTLRRNTSLLYLSSDAERPWHRTEATSGSSEAVRVRGGCPSVITTTTFG